MGKGGKSTEHDSLERKGGWPLRFYRVLVRLYPKAFRSQFGAEMENVFLRSVHLLRLRDRRWGAIRALLLAVRDTVAQAGRLRLNHLSSSLRRSGRGTPDELARRLAGRERGSGQGPLKWLTSLVAESMTDLIYSCRGLARRPGFTLIVALTLGLGVGVNGAVFSVVRSVLLQPLPYQDPQELVSLWTAVPEEDVLRTRSSWANVEEWREETRSLQQVAVHDPSAVTLGGQDGPERMTGVLASPPFFSLLGTSPAIGRTYTGEEAVRRERVVVLSHVLWLRQFGGRQEAVGESIDIDGRAHQIVGVMPPGFGFLERRPALWRPHTLSGGWEDDRDRRGTGEWQVLARLSPATSVQDAQTELDMLAGRLEQAWPSNRGLAVTVVPLAEQAVDGADRAGLWALWGAVGLVFLIACANVASLLLARGSARRREMALRAALGAGRRRLMRMLGAESVLLGGLGGLLGWGLAAGLIELLPLLGPAGIPRLAQVRVDGLVFGFALALALTAGLGSGITSALTSTRSDLTAALKSSGRSSRGTSSLRLRRALAIAQLALAVMTLTGAGLLGRSLLEVLRVDQGLDVEGVLYARLTLPEGRSPEEIAGFYGEVLERLRHIEGIEAVGAIDDLFVSNSPQWRVQIEGQAGGLPLTRRLTRDEVTGGFFRAGGVPLLVGREFDSNDRAGSTPVALVNESMARRFWPNSNPVGQRLRLGGDGPQHPWLTVVGVVGDFLRSGPESEACPQLFRPFAQHPSRSMTLLLRSSRPDPSSVLVALRSQVAASDPSAPVFAFSTLGEQFGSYADSRRFQARFLTAFAAAALLLAAVGVYGLLAWSVEQRTQEIGARMALGATGPDVLRLIVGEGLSLAAAGLAAGLAGALGVMQVLEGLLFGIAPTDPVTLAGVCAVLAAAALAACLVPALRASRTDPAVVLRSQ